MNTGHRPRGFRTISTFSLLALSIAHVTGVLAVTPMTGNDIEAKVGSTLDNMSVSEKINFTGVNDGHMIPTLWKWGLPGTLAYDSSMGVHVSDGTFGAQYPSQMALAASWSINRAKEFGLAIGYETRTAGAQQMLSPGVNLYRTPFNGRASEYVSGEDPFLGSVLAPAVVNALQVQGIQASGKHYAGNEQEGNRYNVNVKVDERTLRELYLPGFESMVKNSNVATIMCGFNIINSNYACENHHLITDILKGEWGYQGLVLSDFNAIKDAQKGAWAGTDLDMPSGLQFNESKILPLLWSGQITQNIIDDKVRRNLRAMYSYGFDKTINTASALTHPEYGATAALNMAREGIVLLRNEKTDGQSTLLPLKRSAKIAVIGQAAYDAPTTPFGTPWAPANTYVTELSGLQQLASSSSNIEYIPGLSLSAKSSVWYQPSPGSSKVSNSGVNAEYFNNDSLSGDPITTRVEPGINLDFYKSQNVTNSGTTSLSGINTTGGSFSARFTGQIKPTISGPHVFKVRGDGAYKLWVNDELVLDQDGARLTSLIVNTPAHSGKSMRLQAGKSYKIKFEFRRLNNEAYALLGGINGVQLSWASLKPPTDLAKYDAVVVSAGFNYEYDGEGLDHSYDLPEYQSEMITDVAKANPNTIVVLHGGGGMNMAPWWNKVAASLHAWYPGQQGGQALAEILFGKINPSGKLPITIDKKIEDNPSYQSYSNVDDYQGDNAKTEMTYSEGIFLGYRGYDKKHTKPLYPFGYGMSYTSYAYSDMKLSTNILAADATVKATFTVTNTGSKAGYEIAQLYVQPKQSEIERPEKELKGFAKVYLKPGESKQVSIPLDSRSLAYYVQGTDSWNVDAGKYKILVGGSSENLPISQNLTTLYPQQLTTSGSNPLPTTLRKAVQVKSTQAY